MKKKILLMISMCLIVLGLTACGEADPTTVDYNGHSYDELKQTCEGTVESLKEMPDEQKQVYLAMEDMTDVQKKAYILSLAPTATEKDIIETTPFTASPNNKRMILFPKKGFHAKWSIYSFAHLLNLVNLQ